MKTVSKRRVGQWLYMLGWDPRRVRSAVREWSLVRQECKEFLQQESQRDSKADFPVASNYFIFGERSADAGEASGHYFHQDLLVAREIFERKPERHVDVGSRVDGFVAHVASFRSIDVIDVRPLADIDGIRFIQADVMNLDPSLEGVADSVSCLHALEHFGLGRYGDPVNYDGWRLGLASLTRMLKDQGVLYLSVPTGSQQRVEFNAHRVFSLPFLRDVLEKNFTVERCAFVTDDGRLLPNIDPHGEDAETSFSAVYGCSIWVLRKKPILAS